MRKLLHHDAPRVGVLPLTVALSLALAAPAFAGEAGADQRFTVMGSASCAGWPKSGSVTSAAKAVPLNWVLGFVSGRALETNVALLDLVNPDEADKWLTSYCGAHPSFGLPAAALALAKELEAKLPPPPPPPTPEPPMFVPPAPAPAKSAPAKPRAPARRPR